VFSQSSSTESINGVMRKRTVLEFPVSGTKGSGVVSVDAKEGPARETEMDVKVSFRFCSGFIWIWFGR